MLAKSSPVALGIFTMKPTLHRKACKVLHSRGFLCKQLTFLKTQPFLHIQARPLESTPLSSLSGKLQLTIETRYLFPRLPTGALWLPPLSVPSPDSPAVLSTGRAGELSFSHMSQGPMEQGAWHSGCSRNGCHMKKDYRRLACSALPVP